MNTGLRLRIESLALETPAMEICGFCVLTMDGLHLIPCTNISATPNEDFEISTSDYLAATNRGRILWVYHTHPVAAGFSEADILSANEQVIPQRLFSIPDRRWYEYYPLSYSRPFEGRQYAWGESDCYTLFRDYFRQTHNIHLTDYDRDENSKDLARQVLSSYIGEGFVRLPSKCQLEKENVLIFRTQGTPQHLGIYLGRNRVLHHPFGMLSTISQFNGTWQQRLHFIAKHKSL